MTRCDFLAILASAWCFGVSSAASLAVKSVQPKPAEVQATADAKIKKVMLTPKAAERLGVQIEEVRMDPSGQRVVPYSSILYGLNGETWVYVHADPMTFVRNAVKIDNIKGDKAYLNDGPPLGTKVLAVAVPEVFGIEAGVGH